MMLQLLFEHLCRFGLDKFFDGLPLLGGQPAQDWVLVESDQGRLLTRLVVIRIVSRI